MKPNNLIYLVDSIFSISRTTRRPRRVSRDLGLGGLLPRLPLSCLALGLAQEQREGRDQQAAARVDQVGQRAREGWRVRAPMPSTSLVCAQPSASWLSRGFSQRQSMPPAARSLSQPWPSSRSGRAGPPATSGSFGQGRARALEQLAGDDGRDDARRGAGRLNEAQVARACLLGVARGRYMGSLGGRYRGR